MPGNPSGAVWNCGGPNSLTGDYHNPNPFGDIRMVMSSGSNNFSVHQGDTTRVMIAQLIAQGNSRLNSVTKLKILADTVKAFCGRGFVIGMQPISTTIPQKFELFQNYPNPFNPVTKIKFSIPFLSLAKGEAEGVRVVTLKVYDVLGREVETLVNEKLSPGTYSVEFDGTNYPSGVYFYKLSLGDFTETKKLILLK